MTFKSERFYLRLGFHYHTPALYKDGDIYTAGYLGRFIDSLAAHCAKLVTFQHTPRPYELKYMDYRLESDNVQLVGLGPHDSIPKRFLRFPKIKRNIVPFQEEIDMILIRGPSPLLPEMARTFREIPSAFLIVGDYVLGVDDLPQPMWRKELIRIWSIWNKKRQLAAAKDRLTFVNSQQLYDEFSPQLSALIKTKTTTLSSLDFYERKDTCQTTPIHLLYTGRVDRAKGLFHMVEAVGQLVDQGEDVVLDLVGWPQKGDPVLDELFALAQSRQIEERIVYHGFKALGPDLFQHYQKADIYIVASVGSEGFPRTIWEAMAHSLPVVATSVGSIPLYLANGINAALVEPGNTLALACAIQHVIHSPHLRRELIANGYATARENTLECRAEEMIAKLEEWLRARD